MSVKGLSGMDVHTNPDRRFTSAGSFISCCPFSYNNFNKLADGPRRQGRGGSLRRGGPADHAQPGPQHGVDAQVHRGRQGGGHCGTCGGE